MGINEIDIKRITLIDPDYSGRRVEVGFEYLKNFFSSQSDFLGFLEKLDSEIREKILYSTHFYWNHDIFRICAKIPEEKPLDIFVVVITFAIIENLLQDVEKSHGRIKDFFTNNLESREREEFKLQDYNNSGKDSVDVLYEARNDFIHNTQRFYFHNTNGFAEVNQINRRNGDSYLGVIKLSREEYLKLFWKAFLRFFGFVAITTQTVQDIDIVVK